MTEDMTILPQNVCCCSGFRETFLYDCFRFPIRRSPDSQSFVVRLAGQELAHRVKDHSLDQPGVAVQRSYKFWKFFGIPAKKGKTINILDREKW